MSAFALDVGACLHCTWTKKANVNVKLQPPGWSGPLLFLNGLLRQCT